MNGISVQQKRFIKLTPSNNSSGGFSPESSQPIIRFSVADTMATANMVDARINFRLRVVKTGVIPVVANTDDFNIDKCLNGCAVLDQVIISSRRYGNQIESVHNLGRLNSSWYSSLYSPKQMSANVNLNCRSIGKGRYNGMNNNVGMGTTLADNYNILQRKYLTTSGVALTGLSHRQGWNQGVANSAASGSTQDAGYLDFSIPLHLGFFQNTDVNLNQVGGLEITCYLAQTRALFYGTGNNSPASTATYSLVDVSLTIPLLYYSPQEVQQQLANTQSIVSFMSWTSIYSVLDSTFTSIAHRLSLKGLLSSIHNTQPTQAINNSSKNNHALINSGIEQLTFLRDGVKNPYEKTMIPTQLNALTLANKSCTNPEILNEYLSAYRNVRDILYTQVIPENLNGRNGIEQGVYGIGANYDPSAGAGVDISGTISYDIQSKLEDITGNNPTQIEPYAFYSYYLSRQDYVVTPQGMSPV